MLAKGIVSAIYPEEKKLSVILPEYDNMTTKPLDIYGSVDMDMYSVNDFVVVAFFNNDFNDGIILAYGGVKKGISMIDSETNKSYELSVVNGDLTMNEILTHSGVNKSLLMVDTKTDKTYELKVTNGDLTMKGVEA